MTPKLEQKLEGGRSRFARIEKKCIDCYNFVVIRDPRKLEFPMCRKCMPKFTELFDGIAKMSNKNRKSLIQVLEILEKKKRGKTKAAVRFILHT
jgi:hypothetical protein